MRRVHIIASLVWLLFSLAVCYGAWLLKLGGLHRPGPGFLPFYTAALLGLLSVISLVQAWRTKGQEVEGGWEGVRLRGLVPMASALFLYAALLNTLGFLMGTFLLLLFLFRAVHPYRWSTVLIASLLTIGATYFLFGVLLESRLPVGFLGF